MNAFVPHADLDLLASLTREAQTSAQEASQVGVGPEGWLETTGVPIDIKSLTAFCEYNVTKLHDVLTHLHQGGEQHIDCSTAKGFTQGMWIEAFVVGAQFMAEKHGWSEFRNSQFPCTDTKADVSNTDAPDTKAGEVTPGPDA